MIIRWTERADQEFRQSADFLIDRNPVAARAFAEAIDSACRTLLQSPKIGRMTEYPHVRQLLVTSFPYKIFYKIDGDALVILSIFHTSRNPEYD